MGRFPFYYGYVIWAATAIITIASAPGQSFTASLFTDYFIRDLELSRTAVSTLFGAGTFLASLGLTWVGRQIDRYGIRRMGVVVAALFALSAAGMSLVRDAATLFIGFTLVRALGVGALTIVCGNAIAQWFHRLRGRMVSLAMVVFSLVIGFYTPWLQMMLEARPWRQVWVGLGIGITVLTVPLIWLVIRDRPEDYGLRPDGARKVEKGGENVLDEVSWTLPQARRTSMLWVFLLGRVVVYAWGTGIIFHLVSIFAQSGFEASLAARALGEFSVTVAVAVVFSGIMIDRLRPGWVLAIQLGLQAVTLWLLMNMTAAWMPDLFGILFGVAFGIAGVFDDTVWPNLFGRLHLGAIRGFTLTAIIIGTALGPVLFGFSFDSFGSYSPVLWAGIGFSAVMLVLGLLVRAPRHPNQALEGSV